MPVDASCLCATRKSPANLLVSRRAARGHHCLLRLRALLLSPHLLIRWPALATEADVATLIFALLPRNLETNYVHRSIRNSNNRAFRNGGCRFDATPSDRTFGQTPCWLAPGAHFRAKRLCPTRGRRADVLR